MLILYMCDGLNGYCFRRNGMSIFIRFILLPRTIKRAESVGSLLTSLLLHLNYFSRFSLNPIGSTCTGEKYPSTSYQASKRKYFLPANNHSLDSRQPLFKSNELFCNMHSKINII